MVQFNVDLASPASNGHWDEFTLEQYTQTPDPTPEPGDYVTAEQVEQIVRDVLSSIRISFEEGDDD